MKKIFTLVVAAFACLNMMAAKFSIGVPTNNADGIFDASSKMITFAEAGSYKPGWWLAWDNAAQDNVGQDYSAYDDFVVELAPTDFEVTVYLEYIDGDIPVSIASSKDGKIVVKMDAKGKSKVKQAYLQVQEDGVGKAVLFKDAYFQNSEAEATSVVIFDTPAVNALDWDANKVSATLSNDAKSLLEVGNTIRVEYKKFEYEDANDRYYQVQVMGSWWTILNSTFALAGVEVGANNAIINLDGNGVLDIVLDAKDIETLKQQGALLFAGHGILIQKVSILKADTPTGISNALVAPVAKSSKIYNLAGQQVDASYKGVVIKNGKKYVQ